MKKAISVQKTNQPVDPCHKNHKNNSNNESKQQQQRFCEKYEDEGNRATGNQQANHVFRRVAAARRVTQRDLCPYMIWASVYNDNYRVIPKVLIWSKNGPSRNFRAANFCANGTWSACCSHHHLSTCPFSANSCWIFLTQVCFHTLCSCLSHSCTNFDVIHPL